MRTYVTRQFRSRERKCMGTKRPGTLRNGTMRRLDSELESLEAVA